MASFRGMNCIKKLSRRIFISAYLLSLLIATSIEQDQPRCYYDVGKPAGPDIVPCFEGGTVSPCCKIGSNCLTDNSCWDRGTGVTYQYGCTDITYQDNACPSKCGLDREKSNWVGLVYCDGTDTTPNNTWACNHPDTCGHPKSCASSVPWDPALQSLPSLTCSDLIPLSTAFIGTNPINSILYLPSNPADLRSYFAAHSAEMNSPVSTATSVPYNSPLFAAPTTSGASVTVTSTPAVSFISLPPASTSSVAPAKQPSHSNNTPLIVGISVGVGLLLLFAYIIRTALWLYRRRRRNSRLSPGSDPGVAILSPSDTKHAAQGGGLPSPGFSLKAELPGDTAEGAGSCVNRIVSEIDGTPVPAYEEFQGTKHERASGEIFEMEV